VRHGQAVQLRDRWAERLARHVIPGYGEHHAGHVVNPVLTTRAAFARPVTDSDAPAVYSPCLLLRVLRARRRLPDRCG